MPARSKHPLPQERAHQEPFALPRSPVIGDTLALSLGKLESVLIEHPTPAPRSPLLDTVWKHVQHHHELCSYLCEEDLSEDEVDEPNALTDLAGCTIPVGGIEYSVDSVLGAGNEGVVVAATPSTGGRQIALKLSWPLHRERESDSREQEQFRGFSLHELRALCQLMPNESGSQRPEQFAVPRIIDHEFLTSPSLGNSRYALSAIVMELIPGESRSDVLERLARAGDKKSLEILRAIIETEVRGLVWMSERGVLPLDVRGDNTRVMFAPTGELLGVFRIDFGQSEIAGFTQGSAFHLNGVVVGLMQRVIEDEVGRRSPLWNSPPFEDLLRFSVSFRPGNTIDTLLDLLKL
ncbi:MAG: hypothetical protein KDD64_12505 [Bdellovibrionales bacterium]|nr:hypothetical protein [Bdellovibrionales bacterium]